MDDHAVTFVNLGNTCYMNSVLQFVRNSTYLQQLLSRRDSALCSLLTSYAGYRASPHELLEIVYQRYPQFRGNLQYDAHEFFLCLMELLSDEFRGPQRDNAKCADSDATGELSQLLQTRYYIVEFCAQCGRQDSREVREDNLILQFDRRNQNIAQMIGEYFYPAEQRRCATCGAATAVSAQIEHFPDYLVLVLNRFSGQRRKLDYAVRIPEILDLRDFNGDEYKYQLNSVVNHYGGISGGHYTATVMRGGASYEISDACMKQQAYQYCDSRAYLISYALISEAEPCAGDTVGQTLEIREGSPKQRSQTEFCFGEVGDFSQHSIPQEENLLLPLALQRGTVYQAVSRKQMQLVLSDKLIALPELSFLNALRRLCLRGLRVQSIDANQLPAGLTYFSAYYCALSEFPDLSRLFGLEIVDVSHNRIYKIVSERVPKQILSLNLSHNRLKMIPDLSSCLCLRSVDLSANKRLLPNFYCLLPATLEHLYLRDCRLRYFGYFAELKALYYLDLAGNSLSEDEYYQMNGIVLVR